MLISSVTVSRIIYSKSFFTFEETNYGFHSSPFSLNHCFHYWSCCAINNAVQKPEDKASR